MQTRICDYHQLTKPARMLNLIQCQRLVPCRNYKALFDDLYWFVIRLTETMMFLHFMQLIYNRNTTSTCLPKQCDNVKCCQSSVIHFEINQRCSMTAYFIFTPPIYDYGCVRMSQCKGISNHHANVGHDQTEQLIA